MKIKKSISVLLLSVMFVVAFASFAYLGCAETYPADTVVAYYFDSGAEEGGDGSIEMPFNDLGALNSIELAAGARVYLKAGSLFKGSLTLEGITGDADDPIIVGAYGEGEKPKIDGNNVQGSGVLYIKNCSNIIVENLELYDSAEEEGDRRGVLIDVTNPDETSDEIIDYKNITVRGLFIHDIRGYKDALNNGMSSASKATGGVHFWSSDGKGRFDGLTVTGNEIYNVDNVGISSQRKAGGCDPYAEDFRSYAFLNVEISYNEIHDIGKNAIFARNLYGGVIEHNEVYDTAVRCYSGNQIVTRSVHGTVVQYNEGYRNLARPNDLPGASNTKLMDGCMLDADLDSRDTLWQYNYSHDNSFGLFLNCTGSSSSDKNSKDVATVRFNLSVNDKGRRGIVCFNYYAKEINFYNNTIITAEDTETILWANNDRSFRFYNNIIYNRSKTAGGASYALGNMSKGIAENNLVFSESGLNVNGIEQVCGDGKNAIQADPLFETLPGNGLDEVTGMKKALVFCRLSASSPALDREFAISVDGVKYDFCGNGYKPSVGCYSGA